MGRVGVLTGRVLVRKKANESSRGVPYYYFCVTQVLVTSSFLTVHFYIRDKLYEPV